MCGYTFQPSFYMKGDVFQHQMKSLYFNSSRYLIGLFVRVKDHDVEHDQDKPLKRSWASYSILNYVVRLTML